MAATYKSSKRGALGAVDAVQSLAGFLPASCPASAYQFCGLALGSPCSSSEGICPSYDSAEIMWECCLHRLLQLLLRTIPMMAAGPVLTQQSLLSLPRSEAAATLVIPERERERQRKATDSRLLRPQTHKCGLHSHSGNQHLRTPRRYTGGPSPSRPQAVSTGCSMLGHDLQRYLLELLCNNATEAYPALRVGMRVQIPR